MYGFHKNVGLSDNSMRASETKSKRPSVYSNPYFKRGRPELLWLITKPKNDGTTMKKKKGKAGVENGDSDDDIKDGNEGIGRLDMTQVSQGAFNSLQREVAQLQRNQQQITAVLTRLRDENNQYLRQAGTMVAAHERHENSINAILTFLATFYNRSQEGQGNLGAMFSGGISDNQPHGNIVDMGDFDGPSNVTTPEPNNMQLMRTPSRRPLAILPPPEAQARSTSAAPNPALHNRNTSSAGLQVPQQRAQPNGARSTASAQSTPTPAPPSPANRVDDMMNVINNANAARSLEPQNAAHAANSAGSPQFDFDAALQHFQTSNGSAPLTNEQRASVLSMMASNSGTSTPQIPALNAGAVNPWASGMEHFQNNSAQIDLLQRMQEEQDWKMSNLADRLQPLSPSGSIPGLEGLTSPSLSRTGSLNLGSAPDMNTMAAHGIPHLKQAPSSDFDINKFLNADYFPEDDGTGDNYNPDSGANFDFDGNLGDQSVFEQPHAAGLIDEEGPGNNDTDMSGFVLHDDPGNSNTSTPGRIGGRVLGSVGSSAGSGINSPRVKTEDEDEATSLAAAHQQQSTTLPVDMRTKKRRRVGE
jgi:heat shock transcription factor